MLEQHRINVTQKFEKENPGYKLLTEGDSFFVEIDFNKVKGFEKLSESAKKLFQHMYKRHNAAQGLDYKIRWLPKSVKEHKDHLEVHFSGKDWLHWRPNGEWD
jgi:hypothetical protein